MTQSKTLVTAEELEKLPHGNMRYELVNGELIKMPPVGEEHGDIASEVAMRLRAYVRQHQLGRVGVEVGFILSRDPDTVRGPDISFTSAERLPEGRPRKGFVQGAPDLAVEVISPNETFAEVQRKIKDYLSNGTRLVWVVEPDAQAVTVYYPDGRSRLLGKEDLLGGEDVVTGFQLRVSEIFGS